MRPAAALACLAALGVGAAGCGSSGGGATRASYLRDGRAACGRAAARLRALDRPPVSEDREAVARRAGESSARLVDDLLALRAPEELASRQEALAATLREAQRTSREVSAAARRHDAQAAQAGVERLQAVGRTVADRLADAGLPRACGT